MLRLYFASLMTYLGSLSQLQFHSLKDVVNVQYRCTKFVNFSGEVKSGCVVDRRLGIIIGTIQEKRE